MSKIQSISSLFLLLLLLHHPPTTTSTTTTNLYFSKTTFFPNYQKMLTNFKIFIYPPPFQQLLLQSPSSPLSFLCNSLVSSELLTHNPNQATLFFLPFDPMPTRSLASHIQHIRSSYPYWNRSLGADHVYFSCGGVGPGVVRNVVELKKNAVQITCFPSPAREHVPHKDVTLPPLFLNPRAKNPRVKITFLCYWRFSEAKSNTGLIGGLREYHDEEFLIESEPSDERVANERVQSSKFCLFVYDYDYDALAALAAALTAGCVPVVITDRPINDFPLMDVIRWSEIALFVESTVGVEEFKGLLRHSRDNGDYEKMKRLGVAAAHHFTWNQSSPQPYDAFYMVMYQLWIRRHAIRYSSWGSMESTT